MGAIVRSPMVHSSAIRSVGHDRQTATLEVEFQDGSVYRYPSVSRARYQGLLAAASPGRYFYEQILRLGKRGKRATHGR